MPIVALSGSAARAICSTLVLNDALSVIKELIDNALDSHATNITIEISANTLDIIQVKDNGGGIGLEDRQLLCKSGFTSKIRTFEDLSQLGGTSLGFRGEALASIANLSDSVTFTTRVDGETVGTLVKFDLNGKLISSSSAAHGTGTTVRVTDFLKLIPVRQQTALKQATKTLNSIKRLLFDYAFARPTVRFQFKVLKSGGDLKANWSFAPCIDANNLNLLTSKIVGKDIAAQCKQFTTTSDGGDYSIDGLLFAQDSDISKCSGTDRFVSIDGRPLAVERGFLRDVNKMYKSYVSSILPEGTSTPNKIFLLLRLQCPRGSYDVNIEPAKNEVMFEDSNLILDLFEKLCKMAYGEKEVRHRPRKDLSKKQGHEPVDFDVLLAQKTPRSTIQDKSSLVVKSPETPTAIGKPTTSSDHLIETKIFSNMFDTDDQDFTVLQDEEHVPREQEPLETPDEIMDPKVFNPFVLAKLNTIQKTPRLSPSGNLTLLPGRDETSDGPTSPDNHSTATPRVTHQFDLLPSPSPSPERNVPYQNPGPPNRPWKTRQNREDADEDDASSPIDLTQPAERTKPTMLDNWATTMNSSSPQRPPPDMIEVKRSEPSAVRAQTVGGPVINNVRQKSPSKRPAGLSSGQPSGFRTPFKTSSDLQSSSPVSLQRTASILTGKSPMQSGEPISPANTTITRFAGFERASMPLDSELDEIMDFEHRKRNTILEHRRRAKQPKLQSASRGRDEVEEEPAFSVPARPEKEGVMSTGQDASYGSKFGGRAGEDNDDDIPPQPNSAGYTQNPHNNRYKKAIRDLEERMLGNAVAATRTEATEQNEAEESDDGPGANGKGPHDESVKMSPKDPRAYLIRHSKGKNSQGNTSGLKKISTTKLPFESIEPRLATYTLIQVVDLGAIEEIKDLSGRTEELSKVDSYVQSGIVSSDMAEGTISEDVLQELEGKVRQLMSVSDIV